MKILFAVLCVLIIGACWSAPSPLIRTENNHGVESVSGKSDDSFNGQKPAAEYGRSEDGQMQSEDGDGQK